MQVPAWLSRGGLETLRLGFRGSEGRSSTVRTRPLNEAAAAVDGFIDLLRLRSILRELHHVTVDQEQLQLLFLVRGEDSALLFTAKGGRFVLDTKVGFNDCLDGAVGLGSNGFLFLGHTEGGVEEEPARAGRSAGPCPHWASKSCATTSAPPDEPLYGRVRASGAASPGRRGAPAAPRPAS